MAAGVGKVPGFATVGNGVKKKSCATTQSSGEEDQNMAERRDADDEWNLEIGWGVGISNFGYRT